jgi:hypothetical protein
MKVTSRAAATSDLAPASPSRAWSLALVFSLATALAIIWPFFWKGNASGHDFAFHAASWMDAAAQWRDGILFPRWTEGANYGFGEPRFIFYPPISWMFGAALSFVVPWAYVPALFIVLTQTMAALSAFALGRRLFSPRGAMMCAISFAANPYALLIIYMRSDFAEQLAMVFFPLLLLFALEMLDLTPAPQRTARQSAALMGITFAAIWLTNAPAGVVASYSLAALFAWTAITAKSWKPLLYGGGALSLGFALAGFYIVPAAYEQSWVNISQALASGLQPVQNFLYTNIADPDHNAFNHVASSTAVLMIALTMILGASVFPRGKSQQQPLTKSLWSALMVLAVVAVYLMLRVSNIFWAVLPKMRFMQFPWRWMSILAIPFACFLAGSIHRRLRWYWPALVSFLLMAVLLCTAGWMVRRTWWDAEDIPTLLEAIENDEGFEGVDEYDPAGDDHSTLPEKSPRFTVLRSDGTADEISKVRVHVERWSAEKKEIRITSREPVRLSLRLLNYPAWRVEVNDLVVLPEHPEESAQMVIPLAAGSSHVAVRFIRTPDRTIGGVVTLCGILATALLFVKRSRE